MPLQHISLACATNCANATGDNAPMFCPQCETEYREGFTRCADCDVALVPELDSPSLVPLTMEQSPDLVAALAEALETARVPYVIEAGTALAILDGDAESLDEPGDWNARIWVTVAKADEAVAILEETRAVLKQQH
jgi:hypothetical protein